MPDLILHRLPFGGVAFEPATEAGADFLASYAPWDDLDAYAPGFGCMTGFSEDSDAIGLGPQDAVIVVESAVRAGMALEAA